MWSFYFSVFVWVFFIFLCLYVCLFYFSVFVCVSIIFFCVCMCVYCIFLSLYVCLFYFSVFVCVRSSVPHSFRHVRIVLLTLILAWWFYNKWVQFWKLSNFIVIPKKFLCAFKKMVSLVIFLLFLKWWLGIEPFGTMS